MEICLDKNETLVLDGDHRGTRILCGHGRLWLTQANDSRDYPLSTGQAVTITSKGRVVIWALTDASVRRCIPVAATEPGSKQPVPGCLVLR